MSPKAKPRSVTAGVRSCYSDAEMKIRNRNVAFRVMICGISCLVLITLKNSSCVRGV